MMPSQLDCEFKNALVNSELRETLLMLVSKDRIAQSSYTQQLGLPKEILLVDSCHTMWNAIFNDVKH